MQIIVPPYRIFFHLFEFFVVCLKRSFHRFTTRELTEVGSTHIFLQNELNNYDYLKAFNVNNQFINTSSQYHIHYDFMTCSNIDHSLVFKLIVIQIEWNFYLIPSNESIVSYVNNLFLNVHTWQKCVYKAFITKHVYMNAMADTQSIAY